MTSPSQSDTVTLTGIWTFTKRDAATGRLISQNVYTNVVPTVGREAIAAQLAGSGTYTARVTYVAVGSDATAPAASDTVLGTEVARKFIAGGSNTSNVATIDGFFNETEANAVLAEAGLFGDGSASQATAAADTGILYSHVAISETKDATETMTVTWTFTVS
jgi:hypothetical protein